MDTNLAAWMITGGPRIELHASERDRAQLHAYLESQRVAGSDRVGLIGRLRAILSATRPAADPACCPA
jgi:hypothetical protein